MSELEVALDLSGQQVIDIEYAECDDAHWYSMLHESDGDDDADTDMAELLEDLYGYQQGVIDHTNSSFAYSDMHPEEPADVEWVVVTAPNEYYILRYQDDMDGKKFCEMVELVKKGDIMDLVIVIIDDGLI